MKGSTKTWGWVLALMMVVFMLPVGSLAEEAAQMEEIFSIIENRKAEPTTFEDYDKLATIAYARGNYDEAISHLDKCIELAGEDAMVLGILWTEKGAIYEKMVRFDEALEALNKAAEYTPLYPQMLSLRADIYNEKKEYGRAITDMQEYVKLLPEDAAGYEKLSTAQRRNGDRSTADENQAIADALAQKPENAILTAARSSALQGDLQTAEQGYTQFLDATEDENGKVHFLRATARMQIGMVEEAILDLGTAIAQSYEDVGVCYEYLSSCQFALGNYAETIEAGAKCVEIGSEQPVYSTLYQRMGISAIALGDMDSAANYFSISIEQDGALVGNYYYRGLARMGAEAYPEAIADLTESITRAEVVQRSLYNRGLCYVQTNEVAAAIADLRETLSMHDDEDIAKAAEDILWQLALQYMSTEE